MKKFGETLADGLLFDMIFIKLIMPGVSGYEAAQQIRDIEEQMCLKPAERHFICGSANDITDRKCALVVLVCIVFADNDNVCVDVREKC